MRRVTSPSWRACSCSKAQARPRRTRHGVHRPRRTGELVDNGQHVLLWLLRRNLRLPRAIGAIDNDAHAAGLSITTIDQDGVVSPPAVSVAPPPLHLAAGVFGWSALRTPRQALRAEDGVAASHGAEDARDALRQARPPARNDETASANASRESFMHVRSLAFDGVVRPGGRSSSGSSGADNHRFAGVALGSTGAGRAQSVASRGRRRVVRASARRNVRRRPRRRIHRPAHQAIAPDVCRAGTTFHRKPR